MRLTALLAAASGCIQILEPPQPECAQNSDCDTSLGEVCNVGVCYGGPPVGQFAAVVVPPSTRPDLASYEVPSIALPSDGDFGDLTFDSGVRMTGRIEAVCSTCDGNSVSATILVSRPSLFPGGPGFQALTTSQEDVPPGSNSFAIVVPRTNATDPPYSISVVPAGNGQVPPADGSISPAMLVPPTHLSRGTDPPSLGTIRLGDAGTTTVTGSLVDGAGHALVRYRVVARGRLEPDGAVTDVSTVAYTSDGQFSLSLSPETQGPISIVAKPYDANVTAPTLTLGGIDVHGSAHTLAQPPNLGNKRMIPILVEGLAGNGEVTPVVGAHVTVSASYDSTTGGASAVLTVEKTTGDDGMVMPEILDGPTFADAYRVQVVPPAGSALGAVYAKPLAIDATEPIRLPARVALHGRVLDHKKLPVAGLAVTARPSVRFKWTMPDAASLAFLGEIPAPTTVTGVAGDFAVYVDLAVGPDDPGPVWGYYDLAFDAPTGGALASYTVGDIVIPRDSTLENLMLPDTILPDSAKLHARMKDNGNLRIMGGELRIFAIDTTSTICSEVPFPPPDCVMPALLVGRGTSDDLGTLKLALPR